MSLRNRVLASVLGVLTAGVLVVPASAASSATDLSVEASAGTIATGTPSKFAKFNVNNDGRAAAEDILLTLDLSGLNQSVVRLDLSAVTGENGPVCEQPDRTTVTCRSTQAAIPAGIQWGWFFPVQRITDTAGPAGHINATVTHGGVDRTPWNNSVRLRVTVAGTGPDMYVVADDAEQVFHVDDSGAPHWGPALRPGEVASALYMVVNQGDTAMTGMRIVITLPRGMTFADADGPQALGCGSGADTCDVDRCRYTGRSAVCVYERFSLVPQSQDRDPDDSLISKQGFYHRIRVEADVVAPARLTGGSIRVTPLDHDVDTSDNADGFRTIVS